MSTVRKFANSWKKVDLTSHNLKKLNFCLKRAMSEALKDFYDDEDQTFDTEEPPLTISWRDDEDYVLFENFKHLHDNMGLRNEPLWNILRQRMATDYEYSNTFPSKTRQDYKERVSQLLHFEQINNILVELDATNTMSTHQIDENDSLDDYFKDPTANYCDFCGLNVFDCNC